MLIHLFQPPVTDGSQLEVEVKPVPSPRPRLQHKSLWNISNNTADSVDTTSNTTKAVVSWAGLTLADIITKVNTW